MVAAVDWAAANVARDKAYKALETAVLKRAGREVIAACSASFEMSRAVADGLRRAYLAAVEADDTI